MVHKLPTAANR